MRLNSRYWVPLAVAVGLALRLYHFLLCPVVWHDEAAMIVNVLNLSFAEMLGPLFYAQAAPPLFLMLERVMVLLFGDSEYVLRLIPFLASCGSVVAVAGLAQRVTTTGTAAVAVGLFAVSERLLWHSTEAKPYSVDVFVAALVAYGFVRTNGWPLYARCRLGIVCAPVMIWLSFPACFVLGAVLVGLLPSCWAERRNWSARLGYSGFALAVIVAFMALALGPAVAQRNAELDTFWQEDFPDWSDPWGVVPWALLRTLEVLRYAIMPYGFLFVGNVIIAAVVWCRRGKATTVVVLVLPIGLALIAALLGKYPYGGTRLLAYATPAVCVLTAEGLRIVIEAFGRFRSLAWGFAALLLAIPVGLAGYLVVAPWPRAACDEAAAYVLQHRGANDYILINHAEYEYYFRQHPQLWRTWYGTFTPDDLSRRKIWVVHTWEPPPTSFPFPLPTGWHVADTIEYFQTVVYRLERDE